jgi:hypothetical protein
MLTAVVDMTMAKPASLAIVKLISDSQVRVVSLEAL